MCETLQLDKVSHFLFFPALLLLCLCFLEAKIDKPGGAVLCVCVRVCVWVGDVKAVSLIGVVLADSLV